MTVPTKQANHEAAALALLPGQFSESEALQDLIGALVGSPAATMGVQELEEVAFQLIDNMWLDNAVGAQLDVIGRHVDQPRETASEDEYRDLLRLKITINTSRGEPERLISILLQLTGASYVYAMDKPPARAVFCCIEIVKTNWLTRVKPAVLGGVALNIEATSTEKVFSYGTVRDAAGAIVWEETHPACAGYWALNHDPAAGGAYAALYT